MKSWEEFEASLHSGVDPDVRKAAFLELRHSTRLHEGVKPAFAYARTLPAEFEELVEEVISPDLLGLRRAFHTVLSPETPATDLAKYLRLVFDKRWTRDVAVHFLYPLAWSKRGQEVVEGGKPIYMDEDYPEVLTEVLRYCKEPKPAIHV